MVVLMLRWPVENGRHRLALPPGRRGPPGRPHSREGDDAGGSRRLRGDRCGDRQPAGPGDAAADSADRGPVGGNLRHAAWRSRPELLPVGDRPRSRWTGFQGHERVIYICPTLLLKNNLEPPTTTGDEQGLMVRLVACERTEEPARYQPDHCVSNHKKSDFFT